MDFQCRGFIKNSDNVKVLLTQLPTTVILKALRKLNTNWILTTKN